MSSPEDLKALQQVYEDYVMLFGREAQFKMVLEEALEFAHAAMKVDRLLRSPMQTDHVIFMPYSPSHPGWSKKEMHDLLFEAVDCLIMIGQLPWITNQPMDVLQLLQERHEHVVEKMKARLKEEAGGE